MAEVICCSKAVCPPRSLRLIGVAVVALLLASCYTLDPEREQSPWFRDGRYHNLSDDRALEEKGFLSVLRWKIFGDADPPAADGDLEAIPAVTPRRREDLLANEGQLRVVWIGHATVWIASQHNGKRFHLITDPIFGSPMFWMRRYTALPLQPEEFPEIHAILISHAHRDHLDYDALRRLQAHSPGVQIYMPSGLGAQARQQGLANVHIVDWWQSEELRGQRITFVPAFHWSRMGLNDMMQYHWGGYVVEIDNRKVYFAGDTAFADHFVQISDRFPQGFDLTLMPIGAFKPRWFMRYAHIDPEEALTANRILGGRYILPVHWGAFALGDDLPSEPGLYFQRLLEQSGAPGRVWTPGEIFDR
ncbi:MAG: MBL fold metallo-hydrolase [Leptospirales bacterium]|nr:MBL fold metallo-hydrolase [Leptospirales bacterium]